MKSKKQTKVLVHLIKVCCVGILGEGEAVSHMDDFIKEKNLFLIYPIKNPKKQLEHLVRLNGLNIPFKFISNES